MRDGIGWEIAAVALGIAMPAMICGLTRMATRTIAGAHAGVPARPSLPARLYVRVDKKQVGNGRHCGSCNQQAPYGYGDRCRQAASQTFNIPVVATRNVERGTIGLP